MLNMLVQKNDVNVVSNPLNLYKFRKMTLMSNFTSIVQFQQLIYVTLIIHLVYPN